MKILPLFLAIGHALAVPAIAEQRLLKLVARSLTPEPSFTIQDGEQMTILSVLVSEDLARSAVAVEVRRRSPSLPRPMSRSGSTG